MESLLSLRVLWLAYRQLRRAPHRGGGTRRRLDAEPRPPRWLTPPQLPTCCGGGGQRGVASRSPRRLDTRRPGNGSASRGSAELKPGGVVLTTRQSRALLWGEQISGETSTVPKIRRTRGRCCFSQEGRGLTLFLPRRLELRWTCQPEPHGQYVFGRSVSPALCGMFSSLEYVSAIDG